VRHGLSSWSISRPLTVRHRAADFDNVMNKAFDGVTRTYSPSTLLAGLEARHLEGTLAPIWGEKETQEILALTRQLAAKEHRSLGNLCFVLLTWATEQLQKAGTVERLLRKKVPIPTQGLQRNKIGRVESTS